MFVYLISVLKPVYKATPADPPRTAEIKVFKPDCVNLYLVYSRPAPEKYPFAWFPDVVVSFEVTPKSRLPKEHFSCF